MTQSSEEGTDKGLGYIAGVTRKINLPTGSNLKVPHMGWAEVKEIKTGVFKKGLLPNSRFYFAHTYMVSLDNPEDQWLTAEYGQHFCAAYHKENIIGVQFHPEKSHKYGLDFLKKFILNFN